ncbi:DUF4192 domain-containing protein [Flexivirga sp. ID2601S]|uniref:DUF4192 domain-containing protein n=1 Tax=Flexivirga aerilata TaxID=1656889 RepID=A0A849ASB8_9MICO|nr:DUF4192 domain-containing protein [Flexivirga aerilata]NNG39622.1 DUF4192 domain-containing protein [Flexivirga aerilata]
MSTLHGVGDVVAYLPYELGFTPHDSVVLIATHHGRLQVIARLDVPPDEHATVAAVHLLQPVEQLPVDDVIAVVYDAGSAADRFVAAIRRRLRHRGVVLSHVIHARDNRWWAAACSCGGCPREWTAPSAEGDVDAIAERVLRGVAPVADREALAGELDQRYPEVAVAVWAELDRLERLGRLESLEQLAGEAGPRVGSEAATDALARVLIDEGCPVSRLPVGVLAVATGLIRQQPVRDAVLAWLMPDLLDPGLRPLWPSLQDRLGPSPTARCPDELFGDRARTIAGRLKEWVQCLPPEGAVPVLLLVAGLHWAMGTGAVTVMALERVLRADPDCQLAQLFDAAVQEGLRPSRREDRRPA